MVARVSRKTGVEVLARGDLTLDLQPVIVTEMRASAFARDISRRRDVMNYIAIDQSERGQRRQQCLWPMSGRGELLDKFVECPWLRHRG